MIIIRLSQRGFKKKHQYKIIAVEKRSKRDGAYLENLGYFNKKKKEVNIDLKRINDWVAKGAKLSPAVKKLIEKKK